MQVKRASMRLIKDVLRLKFESGLSLRHWLMAVIIVCLT